MNSRPSHDEYGLRIAEVVATRATCLRRAVGCVLTNARNQVIATGYNGRAAGLPHCNARRDDMDGVELAELADSRRVLVAALSELPYACAGAQAASGTMLDACEAIHAEQNALLQCGDVYSIHTCYVTHSPCITCVKLLMNTGCRRIVFRNRYAHDEAAHKLWHGSRANAWIHLASSTA
jgi:dCMP deaminase